MVNLSKKEEKKMLMIEALQYCEDEDKSTEFTIQYIQDFAKVELGTVLQFLKPSNDKRN